MIHVIIGENASGKTLYLQNKLEQLGKSKCAQNLEKLGFLKERKLDSNKLEILESILSYDFTVHNNKIIVDDVRGINEVYLNTLSDICSSDKYFIYDELDREINEEFIPELYDILNKFSSSFNECWITSHSTSVLPLSSAKFYKMKEKYNIEQIELSEAIKILNEV